MKILIITLIIQIIAETGKLLSQKSSMFPNAQAVKVSVK